MRPQADSLGRATFYRIKPQANVRPTPRELRWLKHIERHGPQSSEFLFELTCDTHSCKDTALRSLQKLRAGGFLRLPSQQRRIERAEFNPYVYDLTQKAKDHLFERGIAEPTCRPSGHWWHGYAVSSVTSAIDIMVSSKDARYIPAHEILAIRKPELGLPAHGTKLIPDQLFAVKGADGYRLFALEVDRGTEPYRSATTRRTLGNTLGRYAKVLDSGLHKQTFGVRSPLVVLWVFNAKYRQNTFLEMAGSASVLAQQSLLTTTLAKSYPSWELVLAAVTAPWQRAQGADVVLFPTASVGRHKTKETPPKGRFIRMLLPRS